MPNFDILQVKKVKPHVLLGLSGVGGIFNEQVLTMLTSLKDYNFI